jgi:hypothetical protein
MQVTSRYWNDELKATVARGEIVTQGKMTQRQADKEAEEWSQVCQRSPLVLVYYISVCCVVAL